MDLNIQNPWWENPKVIESDEKVADALNGGKVLYTFGIKRNTIILGPRQVGKTTMLKLFVHDLLKRDVNPRNIFYFSCEPLTKKESLIEVLSEYDKLARPFTGQKYIFLDEVTYVDDWELAIKYFIETLKTGILIATGSNASLLKAGTERLPGRDIQIEFFLPLSFREFLIKFGSEELAEMLKQHNVTELDPKRMYSDAIKLYPFLREIGSKLSIYFNTGGYIKAIYNYLDGGISESTYRTYVNWILGDLSKLDRRENIFQGIIRGIVAKYTSSFSLNSFSKEMEIPSHVTASEYLELAERLLLVNNLYQIDINKKIAVFRKERKSYFMDPFMYSVFNGYITGAYKAFIDEPKLIEGIVCEALKRLQKNEFNSSKFLFFYRNKFETDFVFKERGNKDEEKLVGIEVKWGNAEKKDFHNFASFKHRILLNKSKLEYEDGLLLCPVGLFLALV